MNEKNMNIEILRVISTLAVILIHTLKSATTVFDDFFKVSDKMFYNMIINNLFWAVPSFLMITGYLLLNKSTEIKIDTIIKKYVFRMIFIIFTFGVLFAWIEIIFNKKEININQIYCSILNVIQGKTWDHLWYIYMLIGLYLIIPIIQVFFKNASKNLIEYSIILLFIFSSMLPMMENFNICIGIITPISSVYLLYLLIGAYFKKYKVTISDKKINFLLIFSVILICVITWCNYIFNLSIESKIIGYDSPIIIIQSVTLFIIVMNSKITLSQSINNIILSISKNSFGIYIIHMFFINIIYKFFKINPLIQGDFLIILIFISVFILSDLTIIILKKLPLIKKYI
ncbi:acyltransferase [Clostridium butyricum]